MLRFKFTCVNPRPSRDACQPLDRDGRRQAGAIGAIDDARHRRLIEAEKSRGVRLVEALAAHPVLQLFNPRVHARSLRVLIENASSKSIVFTCDLPFIYAL